MAVQFRPSFRAFIGMCFATICVTVTADKAFAHSRGGSAENCPTVSPAIPTASVLQMLKTKENTLDVQGPPEGNYEGNSTFLNIDDPACQQLMAESFGSDYVYSWTGSLCRKMYTGEEFAYSEIDPTEIHANSDSQCGIATTLLSGQCCHNADCQSCSAPYTCFVGMHCTRSNIPVLQHQPGHCLNGTAGHFVNVTKRHCHIYEERTSSSGETAQFSQCWPEECGPGSFAAGFFSIECTLCPLGRYYPNRNAEQCNIADRGRYVDQVGQTAQKECSPGTVAPEFESAQCTPCEVGRFQPSSGGHTCQCALRGNYVDQTGQAASTECAPGTISTTNCSAECDPCPPGQYQPSSGVHECLCAPRGHRPTADRTGYEICPFGTYANSECSPECFICERAWYYFFLDLIVPYDCNAEFAVRFNDTNLSAAFILPVPAAAGSSAGSSSSLGVPENHSTVYDETLVSHSKSSSLPSQDSSAASIQNTFGGSLESSFGAALGR